jgi:signal peptidase I
MNWLLNLFRPVWKRYPNPPVTVTASPLYYAQGFAANIPDAFVSLVGPTGSMIPTLLGGDYVVLAPVPFSDLVLGDIVTYKAAWFTGQGTVIHRLVAKDKAGFIASGDANKRSEPEWRITPASYHAKCVAVFRTA